MQIIGFNFKKISGEKLRESNIPQSINTNIDFTNLEKDTVEFLKEQDAITLSFKFIISYTDSEKPNTKTGEIAFEGNIVLATDQEQSKDLQKHWKKKELPMAVKIPLFNVIIKKCTAKALDIADQINLPPHIPLPTVKAQKKE